MDGEFAALLGFQPGSIQGAAPSARRAPESRHGEPPRPDAAARRPAAAIVDSVFEGRVDYGI